MSFNDTMTLGAARDELRELIEDGHQCPCCTQFAKVYRRKIHTSMASALIRIYRARQYEWVTVADILTHRQIADVAKLEYWGLIERQIGERDDGSKRVGIWRMTGIGREFVQLRTSVHKYARIYDGRCLGMTGEPVTIRDCLGGSFNYEELMYGI